ncbi:MAG: DUF2330 domain-containing protein [Myxococcota bacterium]
MSNRTAPYWMTAVALMAGVFTAPPRAQACGGLFCDASSPVNQAAERIVFAKNPDGTMTAVVQIMYSGPAERFAWVLPVPGAPEVEVSSDLALQRLQVATNPTYQMNTEVEGTCGDDRTFLWGGSDDSAPTGFADGGTSFDAGTEDGPPVSVVDSGNVGPYDYVTLSVAEGTADPADVAVEWLQENAYDVDPLTRERLGPYLEDGLNLIAFRLAKDRSSGSIRPIFINYEDDEPMIPIRPTAVAANEDMGVITWVLGPSRAVPVNYRGLELNEALIDWFNGASNYDEVVTAAANEAGGQGFVTELAQPRESVSLTVMQSSERAEWDRLRTTDWTGREGQLLQDELFLFVGWDGLRDVIEQHVPVPEGEDPQDVYNCPGCYYGGEADIEGFDPAAFVASLGSEVVEPMVRTQELLDAHDYVTRMYTTMSPHEMTVDPIFGFNPVMADVSNSHTVTRIIECSPAVTRADAPWRVELASGDVVRGTGTTWPVSPSTTDLPFNQRILQLDRSSMGSLVEDNSAAITAALEERNAGVPGPSSGGLCSVQAPGRTSSGGLPWLAAAALLGALTHRRRPSP